MHTAPCQKYSVSTPRSVGNIAAIRPDCGCLATQRQGGIVKPGGLFQLPVTLTPKGYDRTLFGQYRDNSKRKSQDKDGWLLAALQNQLYLRVQAPDGGVTNGDVHPIDQVRNNVQQVVIAAPVAGVG